MTDETEWRLAMTPKGDVWMKFDVFDQQALLDAVVSMRVAEGASKEEARAEFTDPDGVIFVSAAIPYNDVGRGGRRVVRLAGTDTSTADEGHA
jgi:hypothetical protein